MAVSLATWGKIMIVCSFIVFLYLHLQLSGRVDELSYRFHSSQKASFEKSESLEKDMSSLTALSAHLARSQQEQKVSYESIQRDMSAVKTITESFDTDLLESIHTITAFVKSFPANRNLHTEIDDLKSVLEDMQKKMGIPSSQIIDDQTGDDDEEEEDMDEEESKLIIRFENANPIELADIDIGDNFILVVTDKNACAPATEECIIIQNLWDQIYQAYGQEWQLGHLKLESHEYIKDSIPKNRPSIVILSGEKMLEVPLKSNLSALQGFFDLLNQTDTDDDN